LHTQSLRALEPAGDTLWSGQRVRPLSAQKKPGSHTAHASRSALGYVPTMQ
jgi:hypothetical protein